MLDLIIFYIICIVLCIVVTAQFIKADRLLLLSISCILCSSSSFYASILSLPESELGLPPLLGPAPEPAEDTKSPRAPRASCSLRKFS